MLSGGPPRDPEVEEELNYIRGNEIKAWISNNIQEIIMVRDVYEDEVKLRKKYTRKTYT